MRVILLLSVLGAFLLPALSASAQAYPPVQPDPSRGFRSSICVDFDRTKPNVCNTNPDGYRFRTSEDCRHYRENGNGTVTILCPEDRPDFNRTIEASAVARTCGENAFDCIGAFFKKEGDRCTYRVVPDGSQHGPYDISFSELSSQRRVLLYKQGEGMSYRNFASQHDRQERYYFFNLKNPQRSQDPCRAS